MKDTLNLLLVDDEINVIGKVVKYALKEHTYQNKFFTVTGTPTSKEAYALLDKEPVDLALVDLVLDEHEGLQGGMRVVKQITEMYPFQQWSFQAPMNSAMPLIPCVLVQETISTKRTSEVTSETGSMWCLTNITGKRQAR